MSADDLSELPTAEREAIGFALQRSTEHIDGVCEDMDIDRRKSMPADEKSAEWRIRRARALLDSVADEALDHL